MDTFRNRLLQRALRRDDYGSMGNVVGFLRLAILLGGSAMAYQYLTAEVYGEKRYEIIMKKYMPEPPEIKLK